MNPLQFDKDGDGKVSKEEAPPQMQERFDMMDTNGDGFIDRADMDALRQRFQQGGGPGGPGGGPGGPGGPGGARP
ncbi:MAG: EF-hand domain-containing protein [Planctomycetales bacterium]|nr:EF-hand domain-containing protein [Planctomycetales bacterium]